MHLNQKKVVGFVCLFVCFVLFFEAEKDESRGGGREIRREEC